MQLSKKQTRADMIAEHNRELEALIGHKPEAVDRFKMQDEMNILKHKLGFEFDNEAQNWLRLHQILMDYEERLQRLESQVGTLHNQRWQK